MLGLIPVMAATLPLAIWTHGVVKWAAYVLYCVAAGGILTLGWRISFGRRSD